MDVTACFSHNCQIERVYRVFVRSVFWIDPGFCQYPVGMSRSICFLCTRRVKTEDVATKAAEFLRTLLNLTFEPTVKAWTAVGYEWDEDRLRLAAPFLFLDQEEAIFTVEGGDTYCRVTHNTSYLDEGARVSVDLAGCREAVDVALAAAAAVALGYLLRNTAYRKRWYI